MQVELILGGQHIIHSIPDFDLYSDEEKRAIMFKLARNQPDNIIAFPKDIDLNGFF